LKVITKWGTGIDSIDLQAAERAGVQVHNTPGAFTEAVADTVLSYVLAFARNSPWMDREMKAGNWEKTSGRALHECTLGVIGVGSIGKAVLKRASTFGMALLGNDIVEIDPDYLGQVPVRMVELETLLRESEFVSINCDLNPSSLGLIGESRLVIMKRSAVLINTARGQVVDEAALIDALQSNTIAGAALDVFEVEPLPEESPLRSMDNVMLAPHNANSSPSAWEHVHRSTLASLFRGLELDIPDELRSK
jgi:D-3-phosphoglycerate dehydrogenase